ncbi:Eco57I restriction-modification methylase domain-containing protein [Oryzomicrobium terrae]
MPAPRPTSPAAATRNVAGLGQVFTPPEVVKVMLALRRNRGRTLEPSAGDGAFSRAIASEGGECVAIEIDPKVAPPGALIGDFFAYPERERFATIIGNPPYVRYQDIRPATRKRLPNDLFDARSNLFLFFIEKAVRHLAPGGELIFIVPRDFIKLTAARRLNTWLFAQGTITDFLETGDARIFEGAVPNCAIFRFEKGRFDRRLHDGRTFALVDGQLLFLASGDQEQRLPFSALFDVKVGAVSGADDLFTHPDGNREFVCSKTAETGETRRMLFDVRHPHLEPHKARLITRRIKRFDESNWWQWGRGLPTLTGPRIYVNGKTRRKNPFFLHECPNFDGSLLALFPRHPGMDLVRATELLNTAVDWAEVGFICDGRYIFGQRSLQNCLLPPVFRSLLPGTASEAPGGNGSQAKSDESVKSGDDGHA